ncbi:amidohydrolase [Kitasatospora sp. MBT63]|uniref:amidohydrolase n=1 Tax=Kitasatospora sp. MBT63 TaxID=1444768 RepID=UPI00053AE65F|nr:amidohydrolase [Kitasatospora sp. MBT63]
MTPLGPATVQKIHAATADVLVPAAALYLDLHSHPELSSHERRTAQQFAIWLAEAGYTVSTGIGGHGVVGRLHRGDGPVILIRAELDALPVTERTGLSYASTVFGTTESGEKVPVMHACGHDLHLAAAAGAATVLARLADDWHGTVLVVGQPGEETLSGARAMLEDGLYTRFDPPTVALAQHSASFPAGLVAHGRGPVMAGSVTFEVTVHGTGGHAASPQLTVDPVVTAAAIVMRLQTVVSRETGPAEPVVLTIGSLHAGSASNVIPDRATLGITARGYSDEVLNRVGRAVHRIVQAECAASGCAREPDITVVSRSPANVPHPAVTRTVRAAHSEVLGAKAVTDWQLSMGAEDFALLGEAGTGIHGVTGIRTAYWMLGTVAPRQWAAAPGTTAPEKISRLPSNHSPEFSPDLRLSLPTGISAMAAAALSSIHQR